jgi:hypothetical protein
LACSIGEAIRVLARDRVDPDPEQLRGHTFLIGVASPRQSSEAMEQGNHAAGPIGHVQIDRIDSGIA